MLGHTVSIAYYHSLTNDKEMDYMESIEYSLPLKLTIAVFALILSWIIEEKDLQFFFNR